MHHHDALGDTVPNEYRDAYAHVCTQVCMHVSTQGSQLGSAGWWQSLAEHRVAAGRIVEGRFFLGL